MNKFDIRCSGADVLDLEQIDPLQGDLKTLSDSNYKKLRKQILDLGFSSPFHVWKNDGHYWCIDGHQRHYVLSNMKKAEGYYVPKLPVVFVEAANEYQAKKKVLAMTSQFGTMTGDSLFDFANINNISLPELEDFRFPEIDMASLVPDEFKEPDEKKDPSEKEAELKTCPSCGVLIE